MSKLIRYVSSHTATIIQLCKTPLSDNQQPTTKMVEPSLVKKLFGFMLSFSVSRRGGGTRMGHHGELPRVSQVTGYYFYAAVVPFDYKSLENHGNQLIYRFFTTQTGGYTHLP